MLDPDGLTIHPGPPLIRDPEFTAYSDLTFLIQYMTFDPLFQKLVRVAEEAHAEHTYDYDIKVDANVSYHT